MALVGLYYGGGTATTAEVFPARVRCSALAVGYNLCLAVFGGTTPMVATYIIEHTGDDLSVAFYLAAAGAISFFVTLRFPETYKAVLR
ncbi:MAG: hypothetical protein NTY59_13055 [Alphaproteobacteria bacterium]|nr:hypothetical protein [Alphaproteobacteria bacterium]